MKIFIVVFEDYGIVTVTTKTALERFRKMPDYRADYLLDGDHDDEAVGTKTKGNKCL